MSVIIIIIIIIIIISLPGTAVPGGLIIYSTNMIIYIVQT